MIQYTNFVGNCASNRGIPPSAPWPHTRYFTRSPKGPRPKVRFVQLLPCSNMSVLSTQILGLVKAPCIIHLGYSSILSRTHCKFRCWEKSRDTFKLINSLSNALDIKQMKNKFMVNFAYYFFHNFNIILSRKIRQIKPQTHCQIVLKFVNQFLRLSKFRQLS